MKEAKALLEKYKAGTCTTEEIQLIDKWLLEIHMGERSDLESGDFEQISKEVWETVLANRVQVAPKKVRLWPRIAVAAAAVAAVTLGMWFYTSRQSRLDVGNPGSAQYAIDIAPGKNGATITLANGKVIQLSDKKLGVVIGQELKYSDGAAVQGGGPDLRQDDVMRLTASTARGQTYQFTLPDGTKVWLNADSKLEFPSSFVNSKTRNVKLSGEGYFEVAKDKVHAFIVEGGGQRVEVLGTHFNINSYADEFATITTLMEGSVKVTTPKRVDGRASVMLKPNQQSVLKENRWQVQPADVNTTIAWKNGVFKFDGTELSMIMRQIGRWYDLDVIYEGRISGRTFNGLIKRDVNLSQILKVLELGGVKFRIEEPLRVGGSKRIIVMQ